MQNSDATQKIDDYISQQDDWKRAKLEEFRKLVHDLQPEVAEEWKWRVPVFTVNGKMRMAMSAFKDHVKYNFFIKGVEFTDPNKLFNNGLDAATSRSIDLKKDETVDPQQLRELVSQFLVK